MFEGRKGLSPDVAEQLNRWEISSERAVSILRQTDRSEVVHTAHVGPLETRRGICATGCPEGAIS